MDSSAIYARMESKLRFTARRTVFGEAAGVAGPTLQCAKQPCTGPLGSRRGHPRNRHAQRHLRMRISQINPLFRT